MISNIFESNTNDSLSAELNNKLNNLETILNSYGRILVALSGGVDSTFLLVFARKVLGNDNVTAITATGPHLAPDEVSYAAKLCSDLGIRHLPLSMDHVMPIIEPNPADRCYLCKKEIFSMLKEKAEALHCVLTDGTNLDDMDDYRPGHRALAELNVASPLKDAKLTKADIRRALETLACETPAAESSSKYNSEGTPESTQKNSDVAFNLKSALTLDNGMPIWEKPAFACLASRIPYGEKITAEKLTAVYNAEVFLRSLGFSQVRVRHHGDIARIEVPAKDRHLFFDESFMDKVNEQIKTYGFKFAALDLGGYKMGGGFHNEQNY